ncbi:MAG: hypothetical protein DWQ18_04360 [Crenarchaeota archaeon]|nr:MAG: hypothetical protein DWQ17_08770 [Thermoproteota archaeon]RDJ34138.1 MAG: hypothetical protein DWQ18_04360 [Thermoproteota archaeon]RDJ36746.1 MAG: hypothetical protein DWQ13_06250 [Thermoproteota archaeon]RDJ37720.1 MAG: hypothetical protein DWQ19_04585 [Thermoproteota archaeon]
MVTKDEYVKGILEQILVAYSTISAIKDKPGTLDNVKKEWLKIHGLLLALLNKLESFENKSDHFLDLQSSSEYYIQNYDFQREIDTMSPLYSDDVDRLKNIRIKVLESLHDKHFIDKIESIITKL